MAKIVPISVSEDYYQISESVLSSFPKYRLPLDLYVFNEKLAQLQRYYKKETRLSNEQIEEIQNLCKTGDLFVSREDHHIYSQHIVKQLDLVLVDENLKEGEVADITIRALEMRLTEFFNQPVKPLFEPLHADCMVFTEYLWNDKHHIKLFMRRLHEGEYNLIKHTLNTLFVGVWLLMQAKGEELLRKELDNFAIGLLLHDIGMTKVPVFILNKSVQLKPDEKDKIPPHVLAGAQIAQKMDMVSNEIKGACLEHHERLDGSGYPQRVKGDSISMFGAMAAVADSFSAMIQKRVNAEAKSQLDAGKELMLDITRYDKRYSSSLYTALLTKAI